MVNEKTQRQIDAMDYHSMLQLWRDAELGNPLFEGEVGAYYAKVMFEKRKMISDEEHVRTSKIIGWKDK